VVSNTPDYGATSVAEHVLGMILALTRHIATAYVSLKEGRWEPGRFQGMELHGKTLGLVGLGPIGQETARLGAGIGMKLIGWTRSASPDRARHGLTLVPLEEVFGQADIVSIHLSLRPETEHLVSRTLLARMKPEAYFVNTARAKIVDTAALADLLRAGKIAGAALDVHDEEPVPPGPYVFRDLPNVLVTPHIGYNTREASLNMLNIAIATIAADLRGERLHVVNPEAFRHRGGR
jgi:D-3-phosphoglycerate dehydrogenase / 2-oxoglutarate reductase